MYCSTVLFPVQGTLLFPSSIIVAFFLSHTLDTRYSFFLSLILTLLSALLFFYFHVSKQLLHHIFLSFSLETKLCSWFSSILVPL